MHQAIFKCKCCLVCVEKSFRAVYNLEHVATKYPMPVQYNCITDMLEGKLLTVLAAISLYLPCSC